MIIISDGENIEGNLTDTIQNFIDAGVIVFSILATEAADKRLQEAAEKTGGRALAYVEDGEISLAAVFAEILSGSPNADSHLAATVYTCSHIIFTLTIIFIG